MAPPIGIRYYNCLNAGIGIIIWPQLRSATDTSKVVWDAPSGGAYKLYINQSVTLDLSTTGLQPSQTFFLSEYTMLGSELFDSSQAFYYDSSSTITAYGVKYGGVDDGSLEYMGCKAEKPALGDSTDSRVSMPLAREFQAYGNAVTDLRLQELLSGMLEGYGPPQSPWKGVVKWLAGTNPNVVAVGITTITVALIIMRYQVSHSSVTNPDGSTVTTYLFGPQQLTGPVPAKVVSDWNAAVQKVQKGGNNPVNEGVTSGSSDS